jgi:hypothetical protein
VLYRPAYRRLAGLGVVHRDEQPPGGHAAPLVSAGTRSSARAGEEGGEGSWAPTAPEVQTPWTIMGTFLKGGLHGLCMPSVETREHTHTPRPFLNSCRLSSTGSLT